jgi:hypothetical protein
MKMVGNPEMLLLVLQFKSLKLQPIAKWQPTNFILKSSQDNAIQVLSKHEDS